jgi:predicted short-subunit dehydrogenase-like oxidoreductase (DUF2520 family)
MVTKDGASQSRERVWRNSSSLAPVAGLGPRPYCIAVEGTRAGLAWLRFSVVGAGRVGRSLASWATQAGGKLVSMASRDPQGALVPDLGVRRIPIQEIQSQGQDLLILAVPDSALAEVAAVLTGRPQAGVVLHTSGSSPVTVLAPLRARGSAIGSLHPLRAFPQPSSDLSHAAGIFFALDGDPEAVELGRRIASAWAASAAVVPASARLLYHFAATLAAGGVATLLAAAHELAQTIDLPKAAVDGYLQLARSALAAGAGAPHPVAAITGPLARGDGELVLAELQALRAQAPQLVPLALALSGETLRQLARGERITAAHRRLAASLAAWPPTPERRDDG